MNNLQPFDFHLYRTPSPANTARYAGKFAVLPDDDKRYFEVPPEELTSIANEVAMLEPQRSVLSFLRNRGLYLSTMIDLDQVAIPLDEDGLAPAMVFYDEPLEPMSFEADEDEARAFFRHHATLTWQDTTASNPMLLPQATAPVQKEEAGFPSVVPASIVRSSRYPQADSIDSVNSLRSLRRTPKPDANQLFHQLKQSLRCLVVNEELFVFNGLFYNITSQIEFTRIAKLVLRQQGISDIPMTIFTEIYRQIITDPELCQEEEYLDDGFITFRNGTLQLASGCFHEPNPQLLTTFSLNCDYIPNRHACPVFENFLWTVTRGDPLLTKRIWQVLGYVFATDMSGKLLFVFQGVPDSGKSVLCSLIMRVFGSQQRTSLNVHELGDKFATGNIQGRRICVSGDMPATPLSTKAVSVLKQLSGHDLITANRKYAAYAEFFCRSNFILVTNHPLKLTENDPAFLRRLVTVPFLYSTPPEQQDPYLLDRLTDELSVIVSRALLEYFELRRNNYCFAGDFAINGGVSSAGSVDSVTEDDPDERVLSFVKQRIVYCPEGEVYSDDALLAFRQMFPESITDLDDRHFFIQFADITQDLFRAKKIRRRRAGAKNPTACVDGVAWKAKEV